MNLGLRAGYQGGMFCPSRFLLTQSYLETQMVSKEALVTWTWVSVAVCAGVTNGLRTCRETTVLSPLPRTAPYPSPFLSSFCPLLYYW